ncbi:hypothetical protein [Mycobacterium sp. 48b]|uniref:hypothetical protein n=1 Tax=Mycobacterium sp. 48b TaxID=3400426 RepID=UPI003AAACF8B
MPVNKPFFGRIVNQARGPRTQDEIVELGGPTRQRLAQIEKGDPVVLTPAVLAQIDAAFGWAPSTSETLLTPPRPPVDMQHRAFPVTGLGVDQSGASVPMPPVTAITGAGHILIPLAERWAGPVLIDVCSGELIEQFLQGWHDRSFNIDHRRLKRTGLSEPFTATASAIDPFPRWRTTTSVMQVLHQIEVFTNVNSPVPEPIRPTATLKRMAVTTLFVSMMATKTERSGLSVISDLASTTPDPELLKAWNEFFESTQLSSGFEKLSTDAFEVFSHLLELRDFHIDLELVSTGPATMCVQPHDDVEILNPAHLNDFIIFYDSTVCPYLPVIVDCAYGARKSEITPLLITANPRPYLTTGIPPVLPNSAVAILTENAAIHRPPLACARLVDLREGSAVLIPPTTPPNSAATRVWITDAADTVSMSHHISPYHRLTAADAYASFTTVSTSFGPFTTAEFRRVHGPEDSGPNLILTDDSTRRLVIDWVTSANPNQDDEYASQLLYIAGFGSSKDEILTLLTDTPAEELTRLSRTPGQLVLPLGTMRGETNTTMSVDLRNQFSFGVIAGDGTAATEMISQAAVMMCQGAPRSDLAVIGVTAGSPRPWVPLADQAHTIAFPGLGIGTRDEAAIARWFDTELSQLIIDRERQLSESGAHNATEYRDAGGVMPSLVVIIDGLQTETGYRALTKALGRIDELDMKVIVCGQDPMTAVAMLTEPYGGFEKWAWSPGSPARPFTATLPGASPDTVRQLIGLGATLDHPADPTTPRPLLRTKGVTPFKPWTADQQ